MAAEHQHVASLLKHCLEKQNWQALRLLFLLGASPNATIFSNGFTLLHYAGSKGHFEAVQLLVSTPSIDINIARRDGATPLLFAAQDGHTETVKLLLATPGIEVNKAMHDGETPLYVAAQGGHTETVKLLLATPGIEVNKAFQDLTPLYVAAYKGHTDIVKLLLAVKGIQLTNPHAPDKSPLIAAIQNKHTEIARILSDAKKSAHPLRTYSILNSAKRACVSIDEIKQTVKALFEESNLKKAELLLSKHPDLLDTKQNHAAELLNHCYRKKNISALSMLLKRNVSPNTKNAESIPLITLAAQDGNNDIVKLFLSAKNIDVNAVCDGDRKTTPLYAATTSGHAYTVELLLAHPKIDVNMATTTGCTALHAAVIHDNCDIVKLLLAANGIEPNKADTIHGTTALDFARQLGHRKIEQLILAAIKKAEQAVAHAASPIK